MWAKKHRQTLIACALSSAALLATSIVTNIAVWAQTAAETQTVWQSNARVWISTANSAKRNVGKRESNEVWLWSLSAAWSGNVNVCSNAAKRRSNKSFVPKRTFNFMNDWARIKWYMVLWWGKCVAFFKRNEQNLLLYWNKILSKKEKKKKRKKEEIYFKNIYNWYTLRRFLITFQRLW